MSKNSKQKQKQNVKRWVVLVLSECLNKNTQTLSTLKGGMIRQTLNSHVKINRIKNLKIIKNFLIYLSNLL